jgi:hypothetical protein
MSSLIIPTRVVELNRREQSYVEPRVAEIEIIAREVLGSPGGQRINKLRKRQRILNKQLYALIVGELNANGAYWTNEAGRQRKILFAGVNPAID